MYRDITTRLLCCCAAIALSAASAFGADLTGIWTGQTVDKNGDAQDLSFRFVQKGTALTGKMYGDNESVPIKSVTVAENKVSFTVTTELNGGVSEFVYTGAIDGDEMELTRTRVDAKKTTETAADALKTDALKTDALKTDAPKTDAPKKGQDQKLHLKRLVKE